MYQLIFIISELKLLGAKQIFDLLRTVFSTKKKAYQEESYRTEVVFEDKNFRFLSSKTTSVLKNSFTGRILSVAKNGF